MKQLNVKKSVLAVALALAYSQLVFAQEGDPFAQPSDTPQKIQRVYVTGSRLAQIESETATPVTVIRRKDAIRSGANTVKEMLDNLTSANGSLDDIGAGNSFAPGASSASLRHLGKQSTLILLNGRRVAPHALVDYSEVFTNLDALPMEAIDRVEVLRNGGSAVYGSDAVAGVINIITRNDYQGVQLSASHDRSLKNGEFNNSKASILGGKGDFVSDGYNVTAHLEVFKRNDVNWRQVIDSINPVYGEKFDAVAPGSGRMFGNRGRPSSASFPGNTSNGPVPGCTTIDMGLCEYDQYSRFEAVPRSERANGMVSGKLRINDKLEAFAEATYSQINTKYSNPFAAYSSANPDNVWSDPRTGERLTFTSLALPDTHPLSTNGFPTGLLYRFADAPSETNVKSSQYRLLTGLKGVYGKYDWETAAGVMGSKTRMRSRGSFSASGFKKTIGDYTQRNGRVASDPDFFNHDYKIGQQNSVEVLDTLFPQHGYDGKVTQFFLDGKVSGEITTIGGRPVGLAAGGELRHEKFHINPTANLLNGDIVGSGSSIANAQRWTGAAFVEINAPVTDKLELSAAARADKYQHFDAHVSPKLSLRYAAMPGLMFRATVESGFRAPNLTESAQSTKYAYDSSVVDPARCPQALVLAKAYRAYADTLAADDPDVRILQSQASYVEGRECAGSAASKVSNNPHLKPETSRSATLGMVMEPVKGYSFSLDYWQIERKDEIGLRSIDELLASEADRPHVVERDSPAADVTFSPELRDILGVTAGPLIGTSGMFENVSKTKTSGVDITGSARFATRFGKATVDANATYLTSLRYHSSARGGYGDNLAGRYGAPKLVSNATFALESGNLSNALKVSFDNGYQLRGDFYDDSFTVDGCAKRGWSAGECKVGSSIRWDYTVAYRGFKGWTLTAFVRNLFDHRPPVNLGAFANSGGGIVPVNLQDVQGRGLRLTAEYRF